MWPIYIRVSLALYHSHLGYSYCGAGFINATKYVVSLFVSFLFSLIYILSMFDIDNSNDIGHKHTLPTMAQDSYEHECSNYHEFHSLDVKDHPMDFIHMSLILVQMKILMNLLWFSYNHDGHLRFLLVLMTMIMMTHKSSMHRTLVCNFNALLSKL